MKNNQRGSVLLWALVVIMVLMIFIGAGLSISFSYFNRSLQYEVKQQVYYSAHSGMEALGASLRNETYDNLQKLVPQQVGEKVNVTNISFSASKNGVTDEVDLGTVTAIIEKIEDKKLKITVKAEKGGQVYTLYGDVIVAKDQGNKNFWYLYQTYDDKNQLTPVPQN